MYDRDLLVPLPEKSLQASVPHLPSPPSLELPDPPENLSEGSSLGAWQGMFKRRRSWAIEHSKSMEGQLQEVRKQDAEASNIQRATAIAVENIKQHVGYLHQKHQEAKRWANEAFYDHATLLDNWETSLQRLPSISARAELGKFLGKSSWARKPEASTGHHSLQSFVNVKEVHAAAEAATTLSQILTSRMSELDASYEEVVRESSDIIDHYNHAFGRPAQDVSESTTAFTEETDAIVKKLSADYETILGLPDTAKSIATITRVALLHARNLLPSLSETAVEIVQTVRKTVDHKNAVMQTGLRYMQRISSVESMLATMQPKLAALDIGADAGAALDTLGLVANLPLVYGSLLVEITRRREWGERMTADSSALAEEMAVHKEEEEKRRKKWLRTIGDYLDYDAIGGNTLSIEVNLKPQELPWPFVSRDEIRAFLSELEAVVGLEKVGKDIAEMFQGLDAPSKQQIRRTNAFKNGSIHDPMFGRNSLLLRGENDVLRSLQSDKAKLEDRLKSSESRVRRLEDLLHRQSQVTKPSNGGAFGVSTGPSFDRLTASPVANQTSSSPKARDVPSRQSSVSSRRFSANNGEESRTLTQRILKLEAELTAEKTKNRHLAELDSNHIKDRDDLRQQVNEAASTKKDLMDNFEAQQHEFDGERRAFQDENNRLKLKLDEVEEELDRMLGSYENVRAGLGERIQELDIALDDARKEAANEARGLHDKLAEQSEKTTGLERELQLRNKEQMDHCQALQITHGKFSADEAAPEDFGSLVGAIETLAHKSMKCQQELQRALESMRAANVRLESWSNRQEEELSTLKDRCSHETDELQMARDALAIEKGRGESLQLELAEQRQELKNVRSKVAAGESGSEALRSRAAAEEQKVTDLTMNLAAATAHRNVLETQIAEKSSLLESLHVSRGVLQARLDARAERAQGLSQELFTQTDRLHHLLEHVGLTVTRGEDGMVVTKALRTDQSQLMRRSVSSPIPLLAEIPALIPDHVHWALSEDPDQESQSYDSFVHAIRHFDITVFSEALTKRVKDIEHTARKWSREAKAYREKFHRAQSEAHEKIAYRSFKDGDLALFLPTRNQATRPWAAFNVGAPHYFLHEQESHKLRTRDWLLARISRVSERVVDLSKSMHGGLLRPLPSSSSPSTSDRRRRNSITSTTMSDGGGGSSSHVVEDENPFELSDGLRWYLLEAAEEKAGAGAPTTPGPAKSTVASAHVDVRGSIPRKKMDGEGGATKTLAKSLDSRHSSSSNHSRKSLVGGGNLSSAAGTGVPAAATTAVVVDDPVVAHGVTAPDSRLTDGFSGAGMETGLRRSGDSEGVVHVRTDLLWGP